MIDIAVFKINNYAGVTEDEWDSDGDLELKCKIEMDTSLERCLVNASEMTENVMELDDKPWAVLVNYNNLGYCRVRFDLQSQTNLIQNLRYFVNTADRTYIWRIFKEMMAAGNLSPRDWYALVINNLRFEKEEQTMAIIFDETLNAIKNGLFTDEQIQIIFNMVSKMELTSVDPSLKSKSALISQFCSEIIPTGLILSPSDMTPQSCYEVIGYQCKSKA